MALVALAACSRIESTGPPTARQLATACIKYAACGSTTVQSCLAGAAFVSGDLSVYRSEEIRCLATTPAIDCTTVDSCIDDVCPRSNCLGGMCTGPSMTTCEGSHLAFCDGAGMETYTDCAILDETCLDDGTFGPHCGPPGAPPCEMQGCDGDVLMTCDFGEQHRKNCAGLLSGGRCISRALACGYDDACSSFEDPVCLGDAVRVCALGEVVEISCTELGFARCSNGACVN